MPSALHLSLCHPALRAVSSEKSHLKKLAPRRPSPIGERMTAARWWVGSFLANNHIRDLEPLASCPRLQAVSLFRNQVSDLDAALMVFDSLPGAPVASASPPARREGQHNTDRDEETVVRKERASISAAGTNAHPCGPCAELIERCSDAVDREGAENAL